MWWRVWIAGLFVAVSYSGIQAQETSTQQTNPPSLRWYQINTPNFRILYPKGFEVQAQRVANTMELIRDPEASTMGAKPRKISLILQNQSAVSNGFVAMAPRRSEFFAMPSQNYNFVGNNDWLNLLASHEYRHIVQYQRSITGFNRFFYYLLGQQALSGMANAAAPYWFWEGDAVAAETAFTRSGRGRIPNFNLLLRTNLLEGRTFNYHKQYLRSYKNNISNHYVLGYHMISYLRKRTGDPLIWEKIAGRSWSIPFIPLRFSSSIHHETGLYVTKLYREMAKDLTTQWSQEISSLQITPFEVVNTRTSKAYTDYRFPQILDDGSVLVQKAGIGEIERLIILRNGKEERKFIQGQVNDAGMLSSSSHDVVWNEFGFDPRWLMRTYSVIKKYDLTNGKSYVLSQNSRYSAAAISPDGSAVATVETTTEYQSRLVLLDGKNGKVLKEFPNPENDFISMPHWSEDGKFLVALKLNKKGKTVSRFDPESGLSTDLFSAGDENIGYPVPYRKYIFYNSPYSGIDNLYAFDTENGKRFQVTCSRYGAYNPSVSKDGKMIYYNDQSRDGLNVVRIPLDTARWIPLGLVKQTPSLYASTLTKQEGHPGLLDSVPNRVYDVRRYHRAGGMINPHSWGTYFANTYTQARFGIYSQDLLSTTSINAGYLYDLNEKTGSYQAGISYQGFYPIIDFQTSLGTRTLKENISLYGTNSSVKLDWKELGSTLGLRLPLLLTRNRYHTDFEVGNAVSLTRIFDFQNQISQGGTIVSKGNNRLVPFDVSINNVVHHLDYLLTDQLNNGDLISNYFHASFTRYLKMSQRDFNPRLGQLIYFEHYSTPYGGDFNGRLWVLKGIAFFPGLFKHHSLWFRGGYQSALSAVDLNTYSFRNRVYKPRGYAYPKDNTFSSASGNYQLPVWYPDIAAGPLLNVQRVKANLFCDYGHSYRTNYLYDFGAGGYYTTERSIDYLSTGAEITFDVNILRLLPQIELGFRVTHINANAYFNSGLVYEFLIGNIPF